MRYLRCLLLLGCAMAVGQAQTYTINTLAGTGRAGSGGDGGPLRQAQVDSPGASVLDTSGRLLFVDGSGTRIRRANGDGTISTVVTAPEGARIQDVAPGLNDAIYYLLSTRVVRAVNSLGTDSAYLPEGVLQSPGAIATDSSGVLVVADGNRARRFITPTTESDLASFPGPVSSLALSRSGRYCAVSGAAVYCASAGSAPAVIAAANNVAPGARVALDLWGDLYVTGDSVRKVINGQAFLLVNGPGYGGDGGPGVAGLVQNPSGIAVDSAGTVYVADTGNHRIRTLRPPQPDAISAVFPRDGASSVWPRGVMLQWNASSSLGNVTVLFGTSPQNLAVAGTSTTRSLGLPDLRDDTKYYWQVRGQIAPLPPVESPVFSFQTTSSTPAPPRQLASFAPANFATGQPLTVLLSWTAVGAVVYDVFTGTSPDALRPLARTSEASLLLSGLPAESDIYWRVVASNAYGSTSSPVLRFSTGPVNGYPLAMDAAAGAPLPTGDGGLATETLLDSPRYPVGDIMGNRYFVNAGEAIRAIDPAGRITTLARLSTGTITSLAADRRAGLGPIFSTGTYVGRVAIRSNSTTILAGQYTTRGFGGDGGPANLALFDGISAVIADDRGNIYVADTGNNRVRVITTTNQVHAFAGNGECLAEPLPSPLPVRAEEWPLCGPTQLALDSAGNLLIYARGILLRVTPGGAATLVAGTGEPGYTGDFGRALDARIGPLSGLATDLQGYIYLLDSAAMTVRVIDPDGGILTWLGQRDAEGRAAGFAGDGTIGYEAKFLNPTGLFVDSLGNVLIGDTGNHRIRQADPAGMMQTVAGTDPVRTETGSALQIGLHQPTAIAMDATGGLIVVDSLNHRIRRISATGQAGTVAGGGQTPVGPASELTGVDSRTLRLDLTAGALAADESGGFVFSARRTAAGATGDVVLRAQPNGVISAVLLSDIAHVGGLARGRNGEIYVSDTVGHRVLRVDAAGSKTVVAGTGQPGAAGDGGPAASAQLNAPGALGYAPDGSLYVAEANRVRRIGPDGRISTALYGGSAHAFAFDAQGEMYLAAGRQIYRVVPNPQAPTTLTVSRIAGNESGIPVTPAAGIPALLARVTDPRGIAVNARGEVFFSDAGENAVRRLTRNIPARLIKVSGDNQALNEKLLTPEPLLIQVVGATGVPVSGITVRITARAGQEQLTTNALVTNDAGLVAFTPSLPANIASFTISAAVYGAAPVEFVVFGRNQ